MMGAEFIQTVRPRWLIPHMVPSSCQRSFPPLGGFEARIINLISCASVATVSGITPNPFRCMAVSLFLIAFQLGRFL